MTGNVQRILERLYQPCAQTIGSLDYRADGCTHFRGTHQVLGFFHSESLGWHANERTCPLPLAGILTKTGFEPCRIVILYRPRGLKEAFEWLRRGMSKDASRVSRSTHWLARPLGHSEKSKGSRVLRQPFDMYTILPDSEKTALHFQCYIVVVGAFLGQTRRGDNRPAGGTARMRTRSKRRVIRRYIARSHTMCGLTMCWCRETSRLRLA